MFFCLKNVLLSKTHTRSVKQNLYLCSSVLKKTYTFCQAKTYSSVLLSLKTVFCL